MRKSILTIFIILFWGINSVAQTVVGEIIDDKPIVTCDKEKLISIYERNLLKASGIDAKFNDIVIDSYEGQYYVFFIGEEIKSAFSAELSGTLVVIDGENLTCTTTDCSSETFGCIPLKLTKSCTKCANKGKCTKVISENSLLKEE